MGIAVAEQGGVSSPDIGPIGFRERLDALARNVSASVVISEETLRFLLLGLVSHGHILLEDTPGVGKTLAARTLALSMRGRFSRIQCTPDLLPSDITGTSVYRAQDGHFEFKPGPAFSNVLMVDEINRASPRTQSALLEAMAEFQVSADGIEHPLPRPFMVIATQNMSESHGVYALPDSQMDRFLIRMSLGLPSVEQEVEILSRVEHGLAQVGPVLDGKDVLAMQGVVRMVNVASPLKEYLVNVAQTSREHPSVLRGISPRGTVSLQQAAQGWAAFEGRDFMIPEDVKSVAPLVLPHRLALRSASDLDAAAVVQELLGSVPVPV